MDASKTGIVMGKHDAAKKERAKQFRQEMTPAEAILWQRLRTNKLDGLHFRRQQIINGLIADFYCHEAGLVVEVDGPVHAAQADADAERDRILTGRGLRVLRFTNAQVVQELPACLDAIRREAYPPAPSRDGKG
jgi:very-short-patch-repair endonuclease